MQTTTRSRTLLISLVAAVAIAAGGCSSTGGPSSTARDLTLVPAASAGPSPFTLTVHSTPGPTTPPIGDRPAAGGRGTVSGTTPGLYGGTQNAASCDVEQMVAFLAAHHDKAQAWADAEGLSTAQIPTYLRSLTPVVLLADTAVTNHGFKAGKATGFQAVLQAGTAVLVDDTGVPRAKCACGNPLLPPAVGGGGYRGPAWPGFSPSTTVTVTPGAPVDRLTLVDPATGQRFDRPVGGNGTTDHGSGASGGGGSTASREADRVLRGTSSASLGDITVDVPFIVTSDYSLTASSQSGYFNPAGTSSPSPSSSLHHAGTYRDLSVTTPEGAAWTVTIRPLGPPLYRASGTGSSDVTVPALPSSVVVELGGGVLQTEGYLAGANGLVSAFAAVSRDDLNQLTVKDEQRAGWTLDLWGLPPGCGPDTGTDTSVRCAA